MNKRTLIITNDFYNLEEVYNSLLDEYNSEYQDIDITFNRNSIYIVIDEEDYKIVASEVTHILLDLEVEEFTIKLGLPNELIL